MTEFEFKKDCDTCKFRFLDIMEFPCDECDDLQKWESPIVGWLADWLNSFDTTSATKCFEAVNLLKMKIAQKEMHEADERLLNSDWGEMEVQE